MAIFRYIPENSADYLFPRWRIIFLMVGVSMWSALFGLQRTDVIGRHSTAGIIIGVLLCWPAMCLVFGGLFGSYNDTE